MDEFQKAIQEQGGMEVFLRMFGKSECGKDINKILRKEEEFIPQNLRKRKKN